MLIISIFLLSFFLIQLSTAVLRILKLLNVLLEFRAHVSPYCISFKKPGE